MTSKCRTAGSDRNTIQHGKNYERHDKSETLDIRKYKTSIVG